MKNFSKRYVTSLVMAFAIIISLSASLFAAEPETQIPLVHRQGTNSTAAGTGILRHDGLWVPQDTMAAMGIQLTDGLKGKGFFLNVNNPAETFDIPALASLAGNSLPLYFPLLKSEGISYFNVTGMEAITQLAVSYEGENAVLTKTGASMSSSLAARTPKPADDGKKISLVWAHVTRFNPDLGAETKINSLGIISPTWFNLTDGMGNVANRASVPYMEAAHKKGYKVWALASNGFSRANTTQLFASRAALNMYVARLLVYAKLYNLDGINIDFESVAESDRDGLVRLMEILTPQLNALGLKSSIDVHVPGNSASSRSHMRGALAQNTDYIMLMAYDEHWRTSKKAGSVASMPWVERAVQNTLAEGVPAEKLVLGVPFYMRRWEETQTADGMKVKGYTLKMADSDAIISSMGLQPVWNDKLGQYFYSYVKNGKTYKVWVEDGTSMARKLALIQKYGLAGAAAWSKGHEKPQIWDVMGSSLAR